MEKTNLERAKELFEKEPGVTAAYFTKDGNMFRVEHYAKDWAKGANGGEIETIYRDGEPAVKSKKADKVKEGEKGTEGDEGKSPEAGKDAKADEKAELTIRYIELFDTKPNHMTGISKLKEAIAAKELEIKNAEGNQV